MEIMGKCRKCFSVRRQSGKRYKDIGYQSGFVAVENETIFGFVTFFVNQGEAIKYEYSDS